MKASEGYPEFPSGIGQITNGLAHVASSFSVSETLQRLESALEAGGVTIFAHIDFSGDAQRSGLSMQPAQMLLFGNPKAGTPLMVAAPTLAIDLPLKVLVWQDAEGTVWLTYNRPEYLQQRHGFPENLLKNIAGVGPLVDRIAGERAA